MSFKILNTQKDIVTKTIDLDLKEKIWRTLDGSSNNFINPKWGKKEIGLRRVSNSQYSDGISTMASREGSGTPNPRTVSNVICKQNIQIPSSKNLTNMVWVWGQFIDHEITLTHTNPSETENIMSPNSPEEDYPGRIIQFERSVSVINSNPREQINFLSSYIDGSNVYGDNSTRNCALRLLDGTGKLKTSIGDNGEVLLPYNTEELPNAKSKSDTFFVAGDIRANENTSLLSMHTLFVREHNRLCDYLISTHVNYIRQDELIYQHARRIVIAQMQNITYTEFLPALLGNNFMKEYENFDITIDSTISTEFSTVGYRLGHTMIPSSIPVDENSFLPLLTLFFNPSYTQINGIDKNLLGLAKNRMQEIDGKIVEDLRSFLFGPPTASNLLDLAALNIKRGRDHGISGYNDVREAYGLNRLELFSEITSDISVQTKLSTLYTHPDNIDPWIGAILEDHVKGGSVGILIYSILKEQFQRIRDGDRFWFENDGTLSDKEKNEMKTTTLSHIINRNTSIQVQPNVFRL